MSRLADLFSLTPPAQPGEAETLVLLKPLNKWPADLRKDYETDVQFVLDQQGHRRSSDEEKAFFCLCAETRRCLVRAHPAEHPECPRYCQGLCAEATYEANGEALGYAAIGAFLGVSKQRVQQIHAASIKKLRRKIVADPEIAEFCTNLGIGRTTMPKADELAATFLS